MTPFALRLIAYLLVIAGVFELEALAMTRFGWEAVLREDGLIEIAEVVVLGVTGILAMALAWRAPRTRGLYAMLAVGLWLIVYREFDNSLAYRALSSPMKIAGVIVLMGGLLVLDRRNIVGSVREVLGRPQGILFVLGTMLIFVWAQLLGQPAFWAPLYRDYGRGRRVVEESLELGGHFLVLFAVIEEHIHLGRLGRGPRAVLAAVLLLLTG
jgi:arginine exporter protein ArgO